MRRGLGVCAVALVLCVFGPARQQIVRVPSRNLPEYFKAFASREDEGRFTRVVLHNGLTILIEEQALSPLAAVVTYVKAGDLHGGEGEQGFARLVAELCLHGTATQNGGETARQLRQSGGTLTSAGGPDETHFTTVAAAEHLARILEIHAGLLRDRTFQAAAIERISSRLSAQDYDRLQTPKNEALRYALELTHPGHYLRLWPAGNRGPTERPAPDSLEAFHRAYYDPRRVILAVSGAVRREQILEKVVALYASLKPSRTKTSEIPDLSKTEDLAFRYKHVRGQTLQPYVVLAWATPGVSHPDYYPLLLLSYILGRGNGSALHQGAVTTGLARDAEARLQASQGGGAFFLLLAPEAGKVDSLEAYLFAQLERLTEEGVAAADLSRAKGLLLKDYYRSVDGLKERTYWLARFEVRGSYLAGEQVPKRIQEVGVGQVTAAARRYLQPSRLSLGEYFPEQAEARTFTAESFLETMRLLLPSALKGLQPEPGSKKLAPPAEPAVALPIEFKPSFLKHPLQRTSILRGPEVYLRQEHVVPLVHVGLFFPGGRSHESAANHGITELLLRTILYAGRDAEGPGSWRELERRGGEVSTINESDFFGFRATALAPHLEMLLTQMITWVRDAGLEEESFQAQRRRMLSLVGRRRGDFWPDLMRQARQDVYADHPYALSRYGTEASLSAVTFEVLQDWFRVQLASIHPLIVVCGDVRGTGFLETFVPTLSDTRYSTRAVVRRELPEESGEESETPAAPLVRNDGRQAAVVFAFPGPARGRRDEVILDVLEKMLGGWGGRFSSLLIDSGLAYEAEVVHEAGINGGAVFVYTVSPPHNEEQVVELLRGELERLQEIPVRNDDFLNAVATAIGAFYAGRQCDEDYVVEVARHAFAGESPDYEREYLVTLKDLSREDIVSVTRRYFRKLGPTPRSSE